MISETNKKKSFEFAEWVNRTTENEIRRLLRYSPKFYFAGGKPGVIPVQTFHHIIRELLDEEKDLFTNKNQKYLANYNYGPTEGNVELREVFKNRLTNRDGLKNITSEDVLITTGSQQALYALCDTLFTSDDLILTTRPSYIGFLQAAEKIGWKIVTIPSDDQGMIVEHITEVFQACFGRFGKKPKIVYSIPYSDNPKGTTLPESRKEMLVDYSHDLDFLIVEDMAYKEIQFDTTSFSPMKKKDVSNERIAYLSTTTKEAASYRIGYSVIPSTLRDEMVKAKGVYDLCSSEWVQAILARYYSKYIDQVLPQIRKEYKQRRNMMIKAIQENLRGEFTRPTGGFFIWYEVEDPKFNSSTFIEYSLKNDISYVPGSTFFPTQGYDYLTTKEIVPSDPQYNTMRLGYSFMPLDDIYEGIKALGKIMPKSGDITI